jgi:Peptidase MA superfamily
MNRKNLIPLMAAIQVLLSVILAMVPVRDACAEPLHVLQGRDITVYYDDSLRPAAEKILQLYPQVYHDLVRIFGWKLAVGPSVLLLQNREYFLRMVDSPLSVAFAVPEKNLIVIDYSRVIMRPFRLSVTLKHELCHILLHQHIPLSSLPRWLDEGLCQWASDGVDEIVMDEGQSILNRAALSKDFISLGDLKRRFPRDERGLILAYQESKSFVSYLSSRFGTRQLLSMLDLLEEGTRNGIAVQRTFSTPLEELEKQWHQSLTPRLAWLAQISYHLYEILFAFAAIVCAYAFVRILLRKRLYKSGDDGVNGDDFW